MSDATSRIAVVIFVSLVAGCGGAEEKTAPTSPASGSGVPSSAPAAPVAPVAPAAPAAPVAPVAPISDARGQKLYVTHCGMCHGPTGKGDGSLARALNPPPRGLADEPWRYLDASTPERERETLTELVKKGKPDAAMPGLAGVVSDEDIARIVTHVLSLRGG